ncbi:hypothetical protein J19TS2_31670 [Cohnella xylanilytica]|uniref:DUF1292 domain-containing protein n=1 Tax=Cohnella xylanilytica TaxID=557555 RepID=A0A841U6N0_9BACL|nr:DUF1292 domain-containing protein [Cohnella xylanilytica]MBB6693933.1 DUF1292 domain-containing protein [Cohnella xylanilytica]GIO13612.1 hypothetical protein J19TS2_31670 [Cohnella xylanilytica]
MSESALNGRSGSLKSRYGDYVELDGASGESERFRILAELTVGGRSYAILQSDAMRKDGEIEPFRVVPDGNGDPSLETIEDDEEWEEVSEAYDDLLFGSEERP